VEVDGGEALEVLPEEALGVVLPDLLPRHGRDGWLGGSCGCGGACVGEGRRWCWGGAAARVCVGGCVRALRCAGVVWCAVREEIRERERE
jgi:hypothetical protein